MTNCIFCNSELKFNSALRSECKNKECLVVNNFYYYPYSDESLFWYKNYVINIMYKTNTTHIRGSADFNPLMILSVVIGFKDIDFYLEKLDKLSVFK